jgi:hypothetical protein
LLCRDVEDLRAKLRQVGLAPASINNDLGAAADMTPYSPPALKRSLVGTLRQGLRIDTR